MRRLSFVVILVLALVAALVWLAGSQSSLQWALGRMVQASHGRLHFEGVRGSLFGAVEISRTRFTNPELEIGVENGSLRFSLLPLLLGHDLVIDRVAADSVTLRQTPSDEPLLAPTDLTLPLAIQLRSLEVKRFTMQWGELILPLSNLRAQFGSDGTQHQLALDRVESPWATASASLHLKGVAPFALKGSARLTPVERSHLPAANITVVGTLLDLKAELSAHASWLSAKGTGNAQPFEPSPLRNFTAEIERLDLRSIDPSLPRAELKGSIRIHTDAEKHLAGELILANEAAGPLSADALPLRRAESAFSTDYRQLRFDKLELHPTRGAPLTGVATLSREDFIAELATRGLDLSALHTTLKPTQLAGNLVLKLDRAAQDLKAQLVDRRYRYDVHLAREGERVQIRRALVRADSGSVTVQGHVDLTQAFPFRGQIQLTQLDPAAFGSFPAARLNGSAEVEGWLKPEWQARVKLELERSTWRGQPLSGHIASIFTGQRFWDSRGELLLGRNEASFRGALGASEDRLDVEFKLASLEQIVPQWQGSARGHARLAGKWRNPSLEIEVTGEKLKGPQELRINALQLRAVATPDLDAPLSIRAQIKELALGALKGDALLLEVEGSGRQHETRLSLTGPSLALKTRLTGGLQSLEQWQGRIEDLEVSQPRTVRLDTPTTLSVSRRRLDVGAARLTSSGGHFDLVHLTLAPGAVSTQGKFSGVPLTLFNLLAPDSGIQATLRLGGEWRIDAAQSLNGFLHVRRESGDILVGGYSPAVSGLSEAWLNLTAENDELRGEGRLVAPRGALVRASFGARAAKDGAGWVVPAAAPIALDVEANLPYLDWLGPFIHPSLVVQGNARATLQGRGTYGNPLLEGRIEGAELAVSEPASGVRLTRGTLQARFLEERLVLEAFQMRGKEGVLTATGEATLRGERRLQLAFQARQLGLLDRPNWDINADTDGTLIADGREARLEARVKVNRAQVGLPEQGAPALSEDVVVKGRTRQTVAQQKSRVALDVTVDLGNAFRVLTIEHAKILKQALPIYESKLDAKLGGILRIRSDPTGAPLASGNIRVVEGVYTFLGKRLEIKRGTFRFDGPLGNPALDILAMNEQLAVKVGASVTGTARNPRVSLVSDPEVPEQEKLSWLLFGHGGQPVDASLSGKATAGSGVALFGFQLSEKLFVGYEQGAAGAGNVMTLYSKLTDRLSVEARTGDQSGLRLFYTYELKR